MTRSPDSLRPAIHEGAFWLLLGASGQKVLGLLSGIALARLLYPADFGVFALAGIAHQLAVLFDGAGTAQYVVVDRGAGSRLDAAHRINVVVAWTLAVLLACISPLAARFFNEPRLILLLPVMALALPLGAFGAVHGALLERELQLGAIARRRMGVRVMTLLLTVILAAAGLGVWALAIPVPVHSAANSILNRRLHPWRPRGRVGGGFRRVLAYGRHIIGVRFANYIAQQLDNAVVGRFLGAAGLGIYDFAYTAAMMPLRLGGDLATRLAFPAMASRARTEPGGGSGVFLASTRWVALLSVPLVIGLVVVARNWVLVLYGDRWAETIPLIRYLAVGGFFLLLARPAVSWMQTNGQEAWPARIQIAMLPLLAGALIFGVRRDLDITALAVAAVLSLQGLLLTATALHRGACGAGAWLLTTVRGALPGLVMAAAIVPTARWAAERFDTPMPRLLAVFPVALIAFLVASLLLARADLAEMWAMARRRGYTPDEPSNRPDA